MPIVEIHLMEGRDDAKKRRLVREVTDAVASSLEVPPGAVRIILTEMAKNHYSVGGTLVLDDPTVTRPKS